MNRDEIPILKKCKNCGSEAEFVMFGACQGFRLQCSNYNCDNTTTIVLRGDNWDKSINRLIDIWNKNN